ncbi:DUF2975 domain-containing protein [Schlegelella sp. S2-27]|uniref:DUF2975 domain-containing protein n=1 Tax=Caldimonas mangrovi TaxID=2944811 RepID=A0ABT0YL48_9BURK|nr:DUF2975 domain-containing protein [Caldimonas mangrovi]MCM5679463.1 DUF2975 domain-containing protein [Caldimonas mangrovi]
MPSLPVPLARVRRLSRWMRGLAAFGIATLGVTPFLLWASPEWIRLLANGYGHFAQHPITINPVVQVLGALAMLPPSAIGIYALAQVWQLFGEYARGEVFGARACRRLRRMALALIAVAVAQPLSRTLTVLALTLYNPPGQKVLAIGISWHDYTFLLVGGVLLAVAWVMVEATRLAQEHAEFV